MDEGTLCTCYAVTRYRNTCHSDVIERVVAAVRAYDGFATSLEVVVLVILHSFDPSFDTATDGLDGVAHSRSVRCWCCCVKGHGDAGQRRDNDAARSASQKSTAVRLPSFPSITDSFLSINTFGASRDRVGP